MLEVPRSNFDDYAFGDEGDEVHSANGEEEVANTSPVQLRPSLRSMGSAFGRRLQGTDEPAVVRLRSNVSYQKQTSRQSVGSANGEPAAVMTARPSLASSSARMQAWLARKAKRGTRTQGQFISNNTVQSVADSYASEGQPKVDVLGVSRMNSDLTTATDRNIMEMGRFFELTRRDACARVRQGQLLWKHPSEWNRADLGRHSALRELRRKPMEFMKRAKRYFFKVLDRNQTPSGHPELRWHMSEQLLDNDPKTKGRLILTEIHYVTATVLQDTDVPNLPFTIRQNRRLDCEFRVVCPGQTVKLVAPDRESMKLWVVGLLHLSRAAKKRNDKFKRTTVDASLWNSIVSEFQRIDQDGSGDVTHQELSHMTEFIPAGLTSEIFKEFDANDDGVLELQEFAEFFQNFVVKTVLSSRFRVYAVDITLETGEQAAAISSARWMEFLTNEQGDPATASSLGDGPFAKLKSPHVLWSNNQCYLTEAGFSHLLCNPRNAAFDPVRRSRVYQDMTQPLSSYWIASSHNTYLTRDQMFGHSRLEQYIEVLLRGCRCVEIDCWDGDHGEPMVTHGYTATTRLVFQDVVRVCKDYGFVASPYPLILSLEVHCGPKQLGRMGQILNEVLGDQLLRLPEAGLAGAELTSPQDAMNKVIVKGKLPMQLLEESMQTTMARTSSMDSVDADTSLAIQANASVETNLSMQVCSSGGQDVVIPDDRAAEPSAGSSRRSVASRFLCGFPLRFGLRGHRDRGPGSEELTASERETIGESTFGSISDLAHQSPGESALNPTQLTQLTVEQSDVASVGRVASTMEMQPSSSILSLAVGQQESTAACSRVGSTTSKASRGSRFAGYLWLKDKNVINNEWERRELQEYARTLYLVARKLPKSTQVVQEPISYEPCNIVSLNEKKAEKLMQVQGNSIKDHLRQRVARVYPNPSRADSSNFDPMPFWLAGFQFVALNYQSMDLPTIVNEGLFRNENGGTGYVLKPEAMELKTDITEAAQVPCEIELTVLCAQYLPKPAAMLLGGVTNPLVRVIMCGCTEDSSSEETRQVQDNGFNPRWDETFDFNLAQPHVAVLAFEVLHNTVSGRQSRLSRTSSSSSVGEGNSFRALFGARRSFDGASGMDMDAPSPGADDDSSQVQKIRSRISRVMNRGSGNSTPGGTPESATSRKRAIFSKKKSASGVMLGGIARPAGNSEILAAAAIPVSGLREGIRWVQLLDPSHHPIDHCGLLVAVRMRGPWAEKRRREVGSDKPLVPPTPKPPKEEDITVGFSELSAFNSEIVASTERPIPLVRIIEAPLESSAGGFPKKDAALLNLQDGGARPGQSTPPPERANGQLSQPMAAESNASASASLMSVTTGSSPLSSGAASRAFARRRTSATLLSI
jgi:hypothetical protein